MATAVLDICPLVMMLKCSLILLALQNLYPDSCLFLGQGPLDKQTRVFCFCHFCRNLFPLVSCVMLERLPHT